MAKTSMTPQSAINYLQKINGELIDEIDALRLRVDKLEEIKREKPVFLNIKGDGLS